MDEDDHGLEGEIDDGHISHAHLLAIATLTLTTADLNSAATRSPTAGIARLGGDECRRAEQRNEDEHDTESLHDLCLPLSRNERTVWERAVAPGGCIAHLPSIPDVPRAESIPMRFFTS